MVMTMNRQLEDLKFTCPKCGTILTNRVFSLLEKITGMKRDDLQNGGLQEIVTTFYAGKVVMKRVHTDIATVEATKEILKQVRELIKPELNEKEKHELENKIKELEGQVAFLQNSIRDQLSKLLYQPFLAGKIQEKQIAKRLKTISPDDEFNTEKSYKEGEDVIALIKSEKKQIGKIVIESKNTKKWNNSFISQIRYYMERENTPFAIIATKTLPDDSANDKMYTLTEDGIWIVRLEYLEIAYRALRDLVTKLEEQKLLSQQKIKDVRKVLETFKEKVISEEYKQKFSNIVELSKTLENMSDRLENYSIEFCEDLDNLAEEIRKNINSIQLINKQILEKFNTN